MTITSAILEFLVLGCLWVSAFLVAILLLLAGSSGSWPQVNLEGPEVLLTLLGIPVAYAAGVVFQAATWRLWYKRIHHNALKDELEAHRAAYQRLAEASRARGLTVGLSKERLEEADDLGGLLDVLRWELLTSPRSEPAQQYLVQFHLYRILYGSIPPLLLLSVVLGAGIWVAFRVSGSSVAFAFGMMTVVSSLLTVLAFTGAKHRRARTWKYLVFGVQALRVGGHEGT